MTTADHNVRRPGIDLKLQWRQLMLPLTFVVIMTILTLTYAPGTSIAIPLDWLLTSIVVTLGIAVIFPAAIFWQSFSGIRQLLQEDVAEKTAISHDLVRRLSAEQAQLPEQLSDVQDKVVSRLESVDHRLLDLVETQRTQDKLLDRFFGAQDRLIEQLSTVQLGFLERSSRDEAPLPQSDEEKLRHIRGVTRQTDMWVDDENGLILHGKMRHVLFRIGTIQQILKTAQEATSVGDMKATGVKMGEGFGKEFVGHLSELNLIPAKLDDLIKYWCDFDISGGWGRWQAMRFENEREGTIEIQNNFLTATATPPVLEDTLCPLMAGYISGVLKVLVETAYPGDWGVKVEEQGECGILSKGQKPCEFKFTLTDLGS